MALEGNVTPDKGKKYSTNHEVLDFAYEWYGNRIVDSLLFGFSL